MILWIEQRRGSGEEHVLFRGAACGVGMNRGCDGSARLNSEAGRSSCPLPLRHHRRPPGPPPPKPGAGASVRGFLPRGTWGSTSLVRMLPFLSLTVRSSMLRLSCTGRLPAGGGASEVGCAPRVCAFYHVYFFGGGPRMRRLARDRPASAGRAKTQGGRPVQPQANTRCRRAHQGDARVPRRALRWRGIAGPSTGGAARKHAPRPPASARPVLPPPLLT